MAARTLSRPQSAAYKKQETVLSVSKNSGIVLALRQMQRYVLVSFSLYLLNTFTVFKNLGLVDGENISIAQFSLMGYVYCFPLSSSLFIQQIFNCKIK